MAKKGKYSGGTDSSGSLVKGLIVVMGILVLFSLGLRLVIGSAGSGQPQPEEHLPGGDQTGRGRFR